jgi:hypothetical protein
VPKKKRGNVEKVVRKVEGLMAELSATRMRGSVAHQAMRGWPRMTSLLALCEKLYFICMDMKGAI